MRYHVTAIREATIKKQTNKTRREQTKKPGHKCWQGCGETGTLCPVSRNGKWCSCYGRQYGDSSKLKNRITI